MKQSTIYSYFIIAKTIKLLGVDELPAMFAGSDVKLDKILTHLVHTCTCMNAI